MDFVINTGDNYFESEPISLLWKVLELLFPAILSLLAAWLVAWWVFVRERRKERDRETEDLNSLAQHYFALIEGLQRPTEKYITNVTTLAEAFAKKENRDIHFEMIASFDFRRIHSLDETTLFKAVVLRKTANRTQRREAYTIAAQQIDYLNKVKENQVSSFTEYSNLRRQCEELWNNNLGGIMNNIEAWVVANYTNRVPPSEDPLLFRILNLRTSVFKDVKREDPEKEKYSNHLDMHRLMGTFIQPLFQILNEAPLDPRSVVLSPLASGCRHASDNLNNRRRLEHESLTRDIERMKEASMKLNDALRILRES